MTLPPTTDWMVHRMLHRSPSQTFSRNRLIEFAQTALAVGEPRYARRLTLAWLATYPGDLPVGLLHARALLQEGHLQQALATLDGLCLADPEYLEAQELLAESSSPPESSSPTRTAPRMEHPSSPEEISTFAGCAFALGGRPNVGIRLPGWAASLRQARKALSLGDLEKADKLIHQSLHANPPTPLAALLHLRLITSQQPAPPILAVRNLAKAYHDRWPGCIFFMLMLASTLMDTGDEEHAVTLLHQSAAQDVTGQVAERLWGADHPYRPLWPARLELGSFGPSALSEIPIPAAVAAALGMNLLPAPSQEPRSSLPTPKPADEMNKTESSTQSDGASADAAPSDAASAALPPVSPERQSHIPKAGAFTPEILLPIQAELEKVAARLDRPYLARADGRFPAYVIFTTRQGLEAQYGVPAAADITAAIDRLAVAVRSCRTWDAVILYADDPQSTVAFGLQPAAHTDAWGLKLLLADLDAALGKRGEMIAAVLIVGGPAIVPFHLLPNPVDDADADVPSDNPYGTRDENYFIPEWPVGRLPGDSSSDGQPLLCTLEAMIARYQSRAQRRSMLRWPTLSWPRLKTWWEGWLKFLKGVAGFNHRGLPFGKLSRNYVPPNLGYTAAIWRRASLAVYRSIGEPRSMLVSPPLEAKTAPLGMPALLGYFNLHGIPDAVEWFGQRDPADCDLSELGSLQDYPVALRPQDIHNDGHAPQVVFSEACYGAHILEKTIEQALALKFLASGTQVVVGSTCTSYGSISMPLIAADLLGRAFWNSLRDGIPAGEALRRAKIALAREMHNRQGYLDGEDQKTLISFVLFGDPLAQPIGEMRAPKAVLRPAHATYTVKTVCDRALTPDPQSVPPDVLAHVKHVVAQYLPGMADARLQMTDEHAECTAAHGCPTAQMGAKSRPLHSPHRRLVTLSKQVQVGTNGYLPLQHNQYARLTLDEGGKLVKLVVSR